MDILVLSVSVFWLFRKPVAEVEHDVCGDTVVPRLGDALGIEHAVCVGELLQEVVRLHTEGPGAGAGLRRGIGGVFLFHFECQGNCESGNPI